ncbi:MAG: exopolyphosphatase [Mucilaginibacter polytrichastri]|nr:exopolyphosphatase [Mucilaginibacter polytrichastri]
MKAVLDLGTNTFHLLIADKKEGEIRFVEKQTRAVKLGEGGINKKQITDAAFTRGIDALREFRTVMDRYPVDEIRATATSAIRNAENGGAFIQKALDETGIRIESINGDEEAASIFAGVQLSGAMSGQTGLVMDIGGGSVEFIIGNEKEVLWKQSVETGAARMMDLFHREDPVSPVKIRQAAEHLRDKLNDVLQHISHFRPEYLVGSAGAFESFLELISHTKNAHTDVATTRHAFFTWENLAPLLDRLIASSHDERKNMKGLIELRVDMIVMASLLTRFILRESGIRDVRFSAYSLKEGVLYTLFSST